MSITKFKWEVVLKSSLLKWESPAKLKMNSQSSLIPELEQLNRLDFSTTKS